MTTHTKPSVTTPSRHDNPFATCWTRPGALSFRFADGQSVEPLVRKLAAQRWSGEIVGPHGSGKSTLLETLKPVIAATGRRVHAISLHDGQRRLPPDFFHHASPVEDSSVAVIDGYEQLSRLQRWRLKRRCRRAGAGLIVTSHAPTGLPELVCLAPDRRLVEQLVGDLCAKVSTGITSADVAASHACHGSNVREILFDLYDRHEELRRSDRTDARANT